MKPFASYSGRFKLNFKPNKTDFLKNLHCRCPLKVYSTLNRSRENSKNEEKKAIATMSDNDHTLSLNFFRIFSQRIPGADPKGLSNPIFFENLSYDH